VAGISWYRAIYQQELHAYLGHVEEVFQGPLVAEWAHTDLEQVRYAESQKQGG
jgi:hypothetical protein